MTLGRLPSVALAAILVAAPGLIYAAMAQTQSDTPAPDRGRGAIIAAQGTASGAPACALCHAFDGASDGSGAFPRIAGQPASYLATQLGYFASGVRNSAIMSPIGKALSAEDVAAVTAYFAELDVPFLPLAQPDETLVKAGQELAKVGNAARGIQACDNCHGPEGAGEPPVIPYLAGQYASYIAFELQMWQSGYRTSSPEEMAPLAAKLTAEDVAAVAAYYQQVRGSDAIVAPQ
ncbi:MAG: Cytochrome c4 [Devosia sp.]|uniref:c-type cytochrome n=1 Tax=Devosia sp. TaxID=1871048 RepID=UPI00261C0034|nr:c-type cytochrome [Devosia sp.]MDB5541631.1 Cytochrome c4 [Devosia sp.]